MIEDDKKRVTNSAKNINIQTKSTSIEDDKALLLDEVSDIFEEPTDFSWINLFITYLTFIVILMVFGFKIYLNNEIYYQSKNIDKIEKKVLILKDENRVLKEKIEHLQYKNQIINTLF